MHRSRLAPRWRASVCLGTALAVLASPLATSPAGAVFRGQRIIDPADLPGLEFAPPVPDQVEMPEGDFTNLPPSPGDQGPSGASGPSREDLGKRVDAPGFDATGRQVVSRSARSTTWAGDNGQNVTRLFSHDVNFHRDGAWHPIETSLTPDAGGGHRNTSGPFEAHFAPRANAGTTFRLAGQGWSVGVAPQGAGNVTGEASGSTLTYRDAIGSADLVYLVTGEGVEELVMLEEAPTGDGPITYRSALTLAGVDAREGDAGIELVRPNGDVVGLIPQGSAWDASGTPPRQPARIPVDVDLVESGGRHFIDVTLDGAWARDPARVFPIAIDPTYRAGRVDAAGGDAFVLSGYAGTASETWPNTTYNGSLQLNTAVSPARYESRVGYGYGIEADSFFHYDTTALRGKIINSATWRAYIYEAGGAIPWDPFAIWPTSEPWSESTVTYNTRPNHRADKITATPNPKQLGWTAWDVGTWVVNWANETWTNYGLTLDSAGDTDPYYAFAADESSGDGTDSYIEVVYTEPTSGGSASMSSPTEPLNTATELVKRRETTSHADLMSASGLGSLIQATVGSFGG